MTPTPFNVGAFVLGAPTSPRALVRHADLLTAYADGTIDDAREAYLSHFVFGPEMQAHHKDNRGSVAGFAGPCWCRWLILDIDRAGDLDAALADARALRLAIIDRYPETAGEVPVWFSGSKGFHVAVELSHRPPPAVGFQRTARALAEMIAGIVNARIDTGIYDVNRLVRLPNTRHPKTGLFKRLLNHEELWWDPKIEGILKLARAPSEETPPAMTGPSARLAEDWAAAEREAGRADSARAAARRDFATVPDARAPKYLVDFLRFGVVEGERHQTLFRCAAWLSEQGSPPHLVAALLTEPGLDLGLTPTDVDRQIRCGIEHARKQRQRAAADGPGGGGDDLPPDATDFPFGHLAPRPAGESEGGPA